MQESQVKYDRVEASTKDYTVNGETAHSMIYQLKYYS